MSVQLRSQCAPLLKTIRHQTRAQYDAAHDKAKPTLRDTLPPVVDIDASPVTSDDEAEPHLNSDDDVEVVTSSKTSVPTQSTTHPKDAALSDFDKRLKNHKKQAKRKSKDRQDSSPILEVPNSSSTRSAKKIRTEPSPAQSQSRKASQEDDDDDDDDDLLSSRQWRNASSQRGYGSSQRRVQGYGSSSSQRSLKNLHTSNPVSKKTKSSSQGTGRAGFSVPEEARLSEEGGQNKANFQIPDELPQDETSHVPLQPIDELERPDNTQAAQKPDDEVQEVLPAGTTRCPVCQLIVNEEYLDSHETSTRNRGSFRWKDKYDFCGSHKRREAEAYCEGRGWPFQIKWSRLPQRMARHRRTLHDTLIGVRDTPFRSEFSTHAAGLRAKRGNAIGIDAAGAEIEAPGYYGTKGGRQMLDWVLREYKGALAEHAVTDALVRERGVAVFAQGVLVRELAALLVADDLKVDIDEAREVVRESTGRVGDLVNQDEEEKVARSVDEFEDVAVG